MDVLHTEQAVQIRGRDAQRELSKDQTRISWGTPNQGIHQHGTSKGFQERLVGLTGWHVQAQAADC